MKKFIIIYKLAGLGISFDICGYFDNRPRININLFFFCINIILPFRNGWTDECDPPRYGIGIHNSSIWLYCGGGGNLGGNRVYSWSIPFIDKRWVRTSILLADGSWEDEILGGDIKNFYQGDWKDKQKKWVYDFMDYDGEIIPVEIYVEEREWRRKWLCWLRLFNTIYRTIDVHFASPCGRRGVLECGYGILPGETIFQCIRRMELEWSGEIALNKVIHLKFRKPKSYINI